ncbi:MAG: GNAT family N-acetyltransferase [Planctomycetes bacterium]|nr:GNAT family N-acetyltransferase [Planctomycetota bacterium]
MRESLLANRRLPILEASGEEEVRITFLDASRSEDVRAWLDLWTGWPQREVTAHPSYVRLFARPGDRVVCAAARTLRGGILYPVIVRPMASEPWAPPDARGCDLTTAYGYGGPYAWNVGDRETCSFWAQFDAWARASGAVTSFARLSLFPEQLLPFCGDVRYRAPNVVRDLTLSEDELWRDYEGKVRRNVIRAQRAGVTVLFDAQGVRLDAFLAVYESTMDRREALSQYYFPRRFFESIITDLAGQFVFLHAVAGSQVIASDLLLLSQEHGYFFLGGGSAESFSLRPNDLLKHEAFLYCRARGIKRFVLGGGYRPEDGVLRFKRSFAPRGECPFLVGVRTYDAEATADLVTRRREWERGQGRAWDPVEEFFPPYRSESRGGSL